jgi:hypothetical protein
MSDNQKPRLKSFNEVTSEGVISALTKVRRGLVHGAGEVAMHKSQEAIKGRKEKTKPGRPVAEGVVKAVGKTALNTVVMTADDLALGMYNIKKRQDEKKKKQVNEISAAGIAKGVGLFLGGGAIQSVASDATQKHLTRDIPKKKVPTPADGPDVSPAALPKRAKYPNGLKAEGFAAKAVGVAKKAWGPTKFAGGALAGGAAAGGAIVYLDKKMKQAEKNNAAQQNQSMQREMLEVEPPVVLVLKRKSIRLFPHGDKVAIYKNDRLGIKFTIPYNDRNIDGDGEDDVRHAYGAMAEGKWSRLAAAGMKGFKKFRKVVDNVDDKMSGVFGKKGKTYEWEDKHWQEFTEKDWKTFERDFEKWARAKTKAEEQMRRDSEKMAGIYKDYEGIPAAEDIARMGAKEAITKYGTAGGVAYAINRVYSHLEKDMHNPNPKRTVNGKPVYEMTMSTKAAMKSGAKIGIPLGAGIAVYRMGKDTYELTKAKYEHDKRMRKKKKKKLDEIAPIAAAAVGRAVVPFVAKKALPAVKTTVSVTKPEKTLARKAGEFVAGNALGGVGTGAVLAHADRKEYEHEQQNSKNIEEATKKGGKSVARQTGKFRISPDVKKQIIIGAAGALGSVAVSKMFDAGYDIWRDNKEVRKEKKIAKATAQANRDVKKPRKIVVQKRIDPRTKVVTIKKTIHEALDYLYTQLDDENKARALQIMESGSEQDVESLIEFAINNYQTIKG